jgi:hypothetical protein
VAFGRPIGSQGAHLLPVWGVRFMLLQMSDAEWEQYKAQQSDAQRKR